MSDAVPASASPRRLIRWVAIVAMAQAAGEASVRYAHVVGLSVPHPGQRGVDEMAKANALDIWLGTVEPKDVYARSCERATKLGLYREDEHPSWGDLHPATRGFFQVFSATVIEVGEALDRAGALYSAREEEAVGTSPPVPSAAPA